MKKLLIGIFVTFIIVNVVIYIALDIRIRKVKNLRYALTRFNGINCTAIFENDLKELDKARHITIDSLNQEIMNETKYIELTGQCDHFKSIRGYFDYRYVTHEEIDFPIAFSILLYKDVEQAERLLRATYRPQNIYCLHVDADSDPTVHAAIDGIANCFRNVFVASRKEPIVYAGYSRLQADLNCMEDLLKADIPWKYFINLPSQEFPIKTNAELVKILKVYNGSNDIEGLSGRALMVDRINRRYFYKYSSANLKPNLIRSNEMKRELPPFNLSIVKGSAYGVFCRAMVQYICKSRIARALFEYLRDVYSPDEYYWATLNHNPHIDAPGSYKGNLNKPWLAAYASWKGVDQCRGKFVRNICIFGVGDLPRLIKQKHLFVNKFYYDFEPIALQCMEEWIFNRSLSDSVSNLNLAFYKALPFINRGS